MNESSQSTVPLGTAPPLGLSELPEGWRSAERDDWPEPRARSRSRRLALRAAAVGLVLAGVIGVLLWVAAGHYARGVEALNDQAYARALSELSAAKVLVFPYRDARALEAQARRGLEAAAAARAADAARISAVAAGLAAAGERLGAADAAGVLATLTAIETADLRAATAESDDVRLSARALADNLTAAAEGALRRAEWERARRLAAALLVLQPASEAAAILGERALTGEKLRAKLAEARAAAQQGRWREALRLALAVVAVREGFPGAAALVADARRALAPKPKPTPTTAPAPVSTPAPPTGGSTTTTPPPPPPP